MRLPHTGPTGVCSLHANEPQWSVIDLLLVNVGPFRALTWGACLKYRMGRKIWKHKNPSVQQLGLFFKLFFFFGTLLLDTLFSLRFLNYLVPHLCPCILHFGILKTLL